MKSRARPTSKRLMTPEAYAARKLAIRHACNGTGTALGMLNQGAAPSVAKPPKARAVRPDKRSAGQSVTVRHFVTTEVRAGIPAELVLPWAPTDNHQVKHTRSGRHYLTPEVTAFRAEVALEARQRRIRNLQGDLVLSIEAHPPDKRRRDVANLFKSICDALQHAGVVADDYQFTVLTIKRREVIKGGVLKCRIYGA